MISAGQTSPYGPQGYPPQGGGYPPQQGYGYPQQQGPGIGAYTPLVNPATPNTLPTFNISGQLDKDQTKDALDQQYMWGGIGMIAGQANQMLTNIFNYALANQSLTAQVSVANKYYDTQNSIAQAQKEVAMTQLSVQEEAVFVQQQMHDNQIRHEQKMAKLEGATEARLAAIAEAGKNRRAEILSMTDAFSRSGWNMGTPSLSV